MKWYIVFLISALGLSATANASCGDCVSTPEAANPIARFGEWGSGGAVNISVSGYAGAQGDQTFAASFGSFDWTVDLGGDNFVDVEGGFQGVSEGAGESYAGGSAGGSGAWDVLFWDGSARSDSYAFERGAGGEMSVGIGGYADAYGNTETTAGVGGAFRLGLELSDANSIDLGGAFQALSEGHGYSEASGFAGGFAQWEGYHWNWGGYPSDPLDSN